MWCRGLPYGQQNIGLTCEVDFIGAHVDKDTEEMLLLYDIPSSRRAAHALQMLYLIRSAPIMYLHMLQRSTTRQIPCTRRLQFGSGDNAGFGCMQILTGPCLAVHLQR